MCHLQNYLGSGAHLVSPWHTDPTPRTPLAGAGGARTRAPPHIHFFRLKCIIHFSATYYVRVYLRFALRGSSCRKQRLAALRILFDWMVVGQVLPVNPAHAVRGPKHTQRRGKTPVLQADEARALLDAIDTDSCPVYAIGR
jgi:integrase